MHMVTAASTAMRNLQVCVRRAHLDIADRAATLPPAWPRWSMTKAQPRRHPGRYGRRHHYSIAVFFEGNLIRTDFIPVRRRPYHQHYRPRTCPRRWPTPNA